jgi:hypothetical protein
MGARSASLQDLILECHAFGVIFLEPCFCDVQSRKHFEMIGVTDLLVRVDVDKDCHFWSLFSFRFPQCVSLRDESNSRRSRNASAHGMTLPNHPVFKTQ